MDDGGLHGEGEKKGREGRRIVKQGNGLRDNGKGRGGGRSEGGGEGEGGKCIIKE